MQLGRVLMSPYERYRSANQIKNFYPYHPVRYRGSFNLRHKGMSELIIELKNKDGFAIRELVGYIIDRVPEVDVICSVPSSNAEDTNNGIKIASRIIAQKLNIIDGTDCLYRTRTRPKSCSGNRSDVYSQTSTLAVTNKHLISGKTVLLLDDVTTSGTTLVACASMLKQAGAKTILKYAIGATVYYGR